MTPPLLTVESADVYARRGAERRTILHQVDASVDAGETVGIVGESGSGKSMLMKAVLGLLPPGTWFEGRVTLDGVRLDTLSERRLRPLRGRRVSLLLQDPFTMLNPVQTVGATVGESLRPQDRRTRSVRRAQIERRLAEVGIEASVATKRPFQLSGGMRQRVAIAAALAADPDLLIADEPTTALDTRTQHEVLSLLRSLQRSRGMALILITHDLRVAFDVCDRILVMYAGQVVEQAPAAALRAEPRHPYTAGLMAAEPAADRWSARLRPLAGTVPAPDDVAGRCAFAARCAWVGDECRHAQPEPVAVGPDRASRCLRIDAIADQVAESARRPVEPRTDLRPAAAQAAPVLLRIEGLGKTFHTTSLIGATTSHRALDGVDLQIAEGESVALVGESGSGKTTIARSVLGLCTPDEGRIRLGEHDITDYRRLSRAQTRHVRRTVQVVFQDPYASLNRAMTIGRTLREAIEARGSPTDVNAEIAATLERVNLPASYAGRLPSGLSGGERQRVCIARAVCLDPRLLICDEPVAALDVSVQAQVLELLRSLRAELGLAMLFITHDLAVVRQMAQRAVVLHDGRIVEQGPTDTVLDQPRHSYTRALIAASPGRADTAAEVG